MSNPLAAPDYVGDLGNGLIRRWSTPADAAKIAQLLGTSFRHEAEEPFNERLADRARLMLTPGFPYMGPTDVAVVEDRGKAERPLVACTCFWRHQWSYAGIPFGVGRPEYVGTDPAYRNRGLVRAIFEMLHARSAAEGHLLQAITGIPYFYRQFGYEYVLDLGGSRTTYLSLIPEKKGDEPEPYRLRHATLEDIPTLAAIYQRNHANSLLWHAATEAYWRYQVGYWANPQVAEQDATTQSMGIRYFMIVDRAGVPCGYTLPAMRRGGRDLYVGALELNPEVNLSAALPALLRALRDHGLSVPTMKPDTPPFSEILLGLWRSHPVYDVLGEAMAPAVDPPYAWYIRVPDIPAFLQQITPVLEERLARSPLNGYTGEVKVDLYREGLKLAFEQGKLAQCEPWRASLMSGRPTAGCPPLVFLQLLLSYRSLAELQAQYPDVWAEGDARPLLNTLFPKQHSVVHPLG